MLRSCDRDKSHLGLAWNGHTQHNLHYRLCLNIRHHFMTNNILHLKFFNWVKLITPYQHSKMTVISTTALDSSSSKKGGAQRNSPYLCLPSILTKCRTTHSQLPHLLPPVLVTRNDAQERINVPGKSQAAFLSGQSSELEDLVTSKICR